MVTAVALAGLPVASIPMFQLQARRHLAAACVPSGAVTIRRPPWTRSRWRCRTTTPSRRAPRLPVIRRRRGAPGQSPDVAAGREPLHEHDDLCLPRLRRHPARQSRQAGSERADQDPDRALRNTIRMPFGCSGDQCLSDAEVAAISAWIANSPRNSRASGAVRPQCFGPSGLSVLDDRLVFAGAVGGLGTAGPAAASSRANRSRDMI